MCRSARPGRCRNDRQTGATRASTLVAVASVVLGAFLLAPHGTGGGTPAQEVTAPDLLDAGMPTVASLPAAPPRPAPAVTPLVTSPTPLNPVTTTAPSSTTTTTRPVDAAETRWPVVQFLPVDTPTFSITWRTEGPALVLRITLVAVVNRADQLAERKAQLSSAKADALSWLAAHGTPAGSYGVIWSPAEAAGL